MRAARGPWWRFAPIALIVLGLGLAYSLEVSHYLSIDFIYAKRIALKHLVHQNLWLSATLFLLLYAVAVAFVFPAPVVLTIGAGFLFGWWLGGLIAVLGATLGGSMLFLAARTAFGSVLRAHADGGTLHRFADGFRRHAFAYLLLLRLTPVLPVAAVNVAPAFFDVPLRTFVVATFLGIIPGALVYAFLGSGLDRALKAAGRADHVRAADLMTPELMVALAGLTLLTLVGIVLKRRLQTSGSHLPSEG